MILPHSQPWSGTFLARVGAPNIGDRARLHRLLDEILDRRWLTNHGPVEREFEARLVEATGTRHCIPVANATLGLMVAFRALEVTGSVLMPSFAFPALPHAATFLGLRPIFCDIDAATHTMSVPDAATRWTDEIGALVGLHTWGRACDTAALERLAGGVPVFYDAASAFGCTHLGRPIGSNGRCEVFSFHATKLLNSFEGGAIATDDDDLAERMRRMINFGFTGRDTVAALGINAKMSEIHAAMGIVSLDIAPRLVAANLDAFAQYQVHLADAPGIRLVSRAEEAGHVNYVVIEVDRDEAGISRDDLMAALQHDGVDVRRYYFPGCHRIEPYRSLPLGEHPDLPVTDVVADRVLQLPTAGTMTPHDVQRVVTVICRALERRTTDAGG